MDVKWMEMENATKTTLTNVAGQAVHALNNTANCSTFDYNRSSRFTSSSCLWIHARTFTGIKRGKATILRTEGIIKYQKSYEKKVILIARQQLLFTS